MDKRERHKPAPRGSRRYHFTDKPEPVPYTHEAFARARLAMLNPLVRANVEAALARTGEAIVRLRAQREAAR